MRKRYFWLMVCFCLFIFAGCAGRNKKKQENADLHKNTKTELTIWLDEDNAMDVRYRIRQYESWKRQAAGTEDEQYYSDITWNLVSKCHLTPKQYRKELEDAVRKGEGPDFICMNLCNGLDPVELTESGMLADLGDVSSLLGTPLNYIPGVLEAGMREDSTYVVPMYMKCPVVFGYADTLKEAGIRTDEMYGSLEEFVDAVLAAAERTGKYAFEDDLVADWLQQYYVPKEDPALAEKLEAKLEQLRGVCKYQMSDTDADQEEKLRAYRMLEAGECLMGGCGVSDYRQLGLTVSLLERSGKTAFLSIPDSSGGFTGLITQAVGVSAFSEHLDEAKKALHLFQERSVLRPDLEVIDDDRSSQLLTTAGAALLEPVSVLSETSDSSIVSAKTQKEYASRSVQAVTDIVYMQGSVDPDGKGGQTESSGQVISICWPDHGGDWPLADWISGAAERYTQKSGTQVQLLPVPQPASVTAVLYKEMDQYDTAPDAVIYKEAYVDMTGPATNQENNEGADFTELLKKSGQETDFLPETVQNGVPYHGRTAGLPLQAREYGIWLNRKVLADAGITEEPEPKGEEGLTELLKKISSAAAAENAGVGMDQDMDAFHAMAVFVAGEELLTRQEDGRWQCSKEGWEAFLAAVKQWKDDNIVIPVEESTRGQAMKDLVSGTLGAVIGSSSLSGWLDGSYGRKIKKGQENVFFIPLSPAAGVDMIFVSKKSEHVQEVFDFWKAMLQEEGYADAVRKGSCIPVTELSQTVRQYLPCQKADSSGAELWNALWKTDLSSEELAEKYPWLK